MLKAKIDRKWFWRIVDFINPLRDPSLTVAAVLTFIEEAGQHDAWYWIIVVALVNWVAVRGVVWLIVNFTFAGTFIMRRVWWAIRHPRQAWRLLDAVGHEEIIIGASALTEGMLLPDGSGMVSLSPVLTASGIQVIGELPAGTEIPLLSMPNGQMAPNLAALGSSGIFTGSASGALLGTNGFPGIQGIPGQAMPMGFPQLGPNGLISQQMTGGFPQQFPQNFPQRPSEEEERLRQQLIAMSRLIDDWIQYTEEKWRTVSDSQLGWKPLRGRWGSWDDIFQDAYAAKTSDPMAQAAHVAGEATTRRFEASREKGSAASAVACFMRDMLTLRQGMEIAQPSLSGEPETPTFQPAVQPQYQPYQQYAQPSQQPQYPQYAQQPPSQQYTSQPAQQAQTGFGENTPPHHFPGVMPRNSLIRRPSPMYVDADNK
ncbi:MAG TPA: hypothetical protein VGT44_12240 [Ktedonobacteraceae bacterium]|nr:hypothetical protein [Ktedonobacteraceae bacterium]